MSTFNTIYYSFSPHIADMERENPIFRDIVKTTITPLVYSLSILNHVSIDSEIELLFWGSSIISLNLGLYVISPLIILQYTKKKFQLIS